MGTAREGNGSSFSRSGRGRAIDLARRFTVADVTPIAIAPSSAALRPRRPRSAASAAAIPNHTRELLAALDNRRSGSSREGVGVSAIAAYMA